MDDADEADRAYEHVRAAAEKIPHEVGPEPYVVTVCLQCGCEIERLHLEDLLKGKPIKRWCSVKCRDLWEKKHDGGHAWMRRRS